MRTVGSNYEPSELITAEWFFDKSNIFHYLLAEKSVNLQEWSEFQTMIKRSEQVDNSGAFFERSMRSEQFDHL